MTKAEQYESVLPQIAALVSGETDEIARMANAAAVLHEAFGFWWTGFYLVKPSEVSEVRPASAVSHYELVLGPFQGPVACTRIPYGRGVCGTAWAERRTIVVGDVHTFAGHIACSSASKSEIVVPIFRGDEIIAVLDIDSAEYNTFDEADRCYLERVAELLGQSYEEKK
jgi:GAF domain-containing protein